jgi:hypothetical protein
VRQLIEKLSLYDGGVKVTMKFPGVYGSYHRDLRPSDIHVVATHDENENKSAKIPFILIGEL